MGDTQTYAGTWALLQEAFEQAEKSGASPIILSSLPLGAGKGHQHTPMPFILVPSGRLIATAIGMRAVLGDRMIILVGAADSVTLGTNHLIHAARRNMGMILLLLRSDVLDFDAGLDRSGWVETGHAATPTPVGTPLEWATELDAGMVARGLLSDPVGLAKLLVKAHEHGGFSMIGVTNDDKLPIGIQSTNDWPEYFTAYRRWAEPLRKPEHHVPSRARAAMAPDAPSRIEVRIAGLGGQGVKLAGTILSEAAGIFGGMWATHYGEYGSATRGGPSRVDVVYGARPITYAGADHPDVLVILSEGALRSQRHSIGANTTVIVDDSIEGGFPEGALQLPLIRLAREHTGKPIAAGIAGLGSIAAFAEGLSLDHVKAALVERLPSRVADENISALEAAYELAFATTGATP